MNSITYSISMFLIAVVTAVIYGFYTGDYIFGTIYGIALALFITISFIIIGMVAGRMC